MPPRPRPVRRPSRASPARSRPLRDRLDWLLREHQALHDPDLEPRNALPWLPELRRWQTRRLEASFDRFLRDPQRRPAAQFFLSDVYNEHDFAQRDADIARVLPMMQRLLPENLLSTVADAIELGLLTHALDLRMAQVLQTIGGSRRRMDADLYARAYRIAGLPRLRNYQIDLIARVGLGLGHALRLPGVSMLLRLSRTPARAAGLSQLQGFLERGFEAFGQLGDVSRFIAEIEQDERDISRRLFAGDPDPFDGAMD